MFEASPQWRRLLLFSGRTTAHFVFPAIVWYNLASQNREKEETNEENIAGQ